MAPPPDLADRFLALHRKGEPLLIPNPWDPGTARLFAALGFEALATTSSGAAATQGRLDGHLDREAVLASAAAIVAATPLPVSADLENGFADEPAGVAESVRLAAETGLAGCSVEDYSCDERGEIYDAGLARERVAAAVEAARGGPRRIVLTARAENLIRGRADLADTIARLQSYQEAGADVLYAPGLTDRGDIERVIAAVDRPVNVLISPKGPTIRELAAAGAARISVGGNLQLVAMGATAAAARELQTGDALSFWDVAAEGRRIRGSVFD